jgi:hypothetical protein
LKNFYCRNDRVLCILVELFKPVAKLIGVLDVPIHGIDYNVCIVLCGFSERSGGQYVLLDVRLDKRDLSPALRRLGASLQQAAAQGNATATGESGGPLTYPSVAGATVSLPSTDPCLRHAQTFPN